MAMNQILKHALLVVKDGKFLVQKEKKHELLLMPGGKPEKGEEPLECLKREIMEELNAEIDMDTLKHLGKFEDIAADNESIITMILYQAELKTKPKPCKDIEKLVWFSAKSNPEKLSPVIRNKILPYLKAVGIIK